LFSPSEIQTYQINCEAASSQVNASNSGKGTTERVSSGKYAKARVGSAGSIDRFHHNVSDFVPGRQPTHADLAQRILPTELRHWCRDQRVRSRTTIAHGYGCEKFTIFGSAKGDDNELVGGIHGDEAGSIVYWSPAIIVNERA
jgi:hypothetical protein